ncbi:MAG: tRNA (adenosine(37)-N6)-dimethylallyltransferase MiaA [Chloroflexi bacterium]|nr:tRNA (adenosine(37)-N6)-dimethylallyltransferase MiaA [Chloroflexota bacterium]
MTVPVIAVVGPTGAGKTGLSIALAEEIGGEIINGDSRQVYRHMDIGTAKPTPEQRARVPHHLFDIVDPDQEFNLALYKEKALQALADILRREKRPILVGGTGQYIWAVIEGWAVPPIAPDITFRKTLEREAAARGYEGLHLRLGEVDPASARSIDPKNVRRVIRALEVWHSSGVPFSCWRGKQRPPFQTRILGVTLPREELYTRIDARVDAMLAGGLTQEVAKLREMGYHVDLPPMTGIGYMEISSYLDGQTDLESATTRIKFRTHHLARRQYAWFALDDPRIKWVGPDEQGLGSAVGPAL